MEEISKEPQKIRTGTFKDEDMTLFRYILKDGAAPSEQIKILFTVISLYKMELNTNTSFNQGIEPENGYEIDSVTITGDAGYVIHNMEQVRKQLINYFADMHKLLYYCRYKHMFDVLELCAFWSYGADLHLRLLLKQKTIMPTIKVS